MPRTETLKEAVDTSAELLLHAYRSISDDDNESVVALREYPETLRHCRLILRNIADDASRLKQFLDNADRAELHLMKLKEQRGA